MPQMHRRTFCAAIAAGLLLPMATLAQLDKPINQAINYLEPRGLFVARYKVPATDPTVLDVAYYHDGQAGAGDNTRRQLSLRSDGTAIGFPGHYSLTPIDDAATDMGAVEIEVTRTSKTGLDVVIYRSGTQVARGLAVIDPDDSRSLLVSGWTAETEPYGVAKYRIRDAETIVGHYLSKMSPDHLGTDTAIGDTTNGFPGKYSLTTLEVSGRTWGPHDWRLSRRGDLIDLVWREEGKVISRGFGIVDPEDPASIVVTYIPADE